MFPGRTIFSTIVSNSAHSNNATAKCIIYSGIHTRVNHSSQTTELSYFLPSENITIPFICQIPYLNFYFSLLKFIYWK